MATIINMNIERLFLALLVGLLLTNAGFSQSKSKSKSPASDLDALIVQGMKDWEIPGMAVVVVKNGEVVFKRPYGVKSISKKDPVDENTLFNMGSTTKALIAMSVGILVDRGQLEWEDKVIDHMPSFRLSDPYITAEARVKDLLTHNLGIGDADLIWIVDSLSTEETLKKFQLAEKAYPLRGGFIYQNLMYAEAGELIQAVSGQHWTGFVEENLFKPLGFTRTVAKSVDILKAGNYTTPHYDDPDEGVVEVGYTFSDQIGAAGMIWASINDMGNYLQFLTNDGVYKGDTILQPATFKYLFKAHSFVGEDFFYPTQALTHPDWMTYGLGWFQQNYKGKKLDFHTGSIAGLIAIAAVMHDENTAVYVLCNLDHAELRHAVMFKALDLYAFNDNSRDWHKEIFDLYSGFKQQSLIAAKKVEEARVLNTKPTLALEAYAGTYQHKMYGTVKVTATSAGLSFNFNDYLYQEAAHWHYDTFRAPKHPKWRFELMYDFNIGPDAQVQDMNVFGQRFVRVKE